MTKDEQAFILNETWLSRVNFRYWCERYVTIALDGGGVGKLKLAASQVAAHDRHLAPAELGMWEAHKAGDPVDGLLFYWHKARQLYATALCRALGMHRMSLFHNVRALAGSVDDDKVMELYDRDKLILDNLPWYMKPNFNPKDGGYDVKAQHIYFVDLKSRLLYQAGGQRGGMGQGRQFDFHHLTECAFWDQPDYHIDYVLNPAIPASLTTLGFRESTANGRGNWWHRETEAARRKRKVRWCYIFIPWYAVETKYRAKPPVDWTPSDLTKAHIDLVARTSPEFMGYTVNLSREQAYWYELNRAEYQRDGRLNLFLTNYCATPEESFQHSNVGAFPPELLEKLRLGTKEPNRAYEPFVI